MPTLAILDNLESSKDRRKTAELLGRRGAIAGLRLIITIRGATPLLPAPGALILQDIEPLAYADACALFLRYAGDQFAADPALPDLLRALDGHPLSIELLAANAAGRADLTAVFLDWKRFREKLLWRGDDEPSLRASLELSLKALRQPSAEHRLIRVMALLPDGMADRDCAACLSDGQPSDEESDAARGLENGPPRQPPRRPLAAAGPGPRKPPAHFPPEPGDRARLIKLFLERACQGKKVRTRDWSNAREELLAEAGNLDAIIEIAVNEPKLPDALLPAVVGLAKLHSATGLASTVSLMRAASRFREKRLLLEAAICTERAGQTALARSDHKTAMEYFRIARSTFEEHRDLRRQAMCIEGLGDIALRRSKLNLAKKHYTTALQLYEQIDRVRGKAVCLERFGDIDLRRFDDARASEFFQKALPLFKQVGYLLGEAGCISRLGDVALRRWNLKVARKCYREASRLYNEVDDVRGQAGCIERLGDVAVRQAELEKAREDYSEASSLFRQDNEFSDCASRTKLGSATVLRLTRLARDLYGKALQLYKQIGDAMGEGGCIKRLGDVALIRSEFAEARNLLENALRIFNQIGDLRGEAACTEHIGEIALAKSDHEAALQHYRAALQLFTKVDDVLGKANCVRGLADVHEKKGAIEDALKGWAEALISTMEFPNRIGSAAFTSV